MYARKKKESETVSLVHSIAENCRVSNFVVSLRTIDLITRSYVDILSALGVPWPNESIKVYDSAKKSNKRITENLSLLAVF